ncbi:hypothetical protein D9758_017969 [Tetrapyrgos nigripes]|uniref:Uncharacterized protein n=1 Tax=Tetrapyrgos nigripes TaxID=182062 RepID=A0A8H5C2Q0_9AGAR|nr:hypothetical protein D9758_017100 [Tetrapyrgos nigripes]KAF5335584.1 hypothetical protein D9758_017969 [Tetrapyrgos nigripes]
MPRGIGIGTGNLNDSTMVTNTSHTVTYPNPIPDRYTVIGQGSSGCNTVIEGIVGLVAGAPRYLCNCVLVLDPVPGSPLSPSCLDDIRKSMSSPDPEPDWRNGITDTSTLT